jgi:hypothetical protein
LALGDAAGGPDEARLRIAPSLVAATPAVIQAAVANEPHERDLELAAAG